MQYNIINIIYANILFNFLLIIPPELIGKIVNCLYLQKLLFFDYPNKNIEKYHISLHQ